MIRNQQQRRIWIGGLFAMLIGLGACGDDATPRAKKTDDPNVIIHELNDPRRINPPISTSANATYIESNIFEGLLIIDSETLEFQPYLAVARPSIKEIEEGPYAGGMSLSYEIRPEASWDNGEPITGYDYAFTIKAIKTPQVNAQNLRPYMDFIDSVYVNPEEPKKFTVFSKKRYMLAEAFSGYNIMPRYAYDSNNYLANLSFAALNDTSAQVQAALLEREDLIAFATYFNDIETGQSPERIVGSGPYRLTEWQQDIRVVLSRKKDWWGDKLDAENIKAFPPKIIYRVIPNKSTAVTAMKDETIDIMKGVEARKFKELKEDPHYSEVFRLESPTQFAYFTIGFNFNDPRLQDKKVRQALAHVVNRDQIIEVLFYGMGKKINGPIHPKKRYYNEEIPDIPFDLEKAAALLKEAGWKDSDGDGVLDKEINGAKTSMDLVYLVNAESKERRKIGLLFQESAMKIGINIKIKPLDFNMYLDNANNRNFDLLALAWAQAPTEDDLKQVWHSASSVQGGGNRLDYKNPKVDSLIDELRVTLDKTKRDAMYKELQQTLYEEQANIFLIAPDSRLAIHGRFEQAETSVLRPGYSERYFTIPTPNAIEAQ